ncbi:MAG: ATP-binding protein, partial [Actinomycetota bacterium]|nr:ATP-binding protein [Actinomycetota bacterium]
MPRPANPYRPGFNQPPAALAGRDAVLQAVREALDVAALDARTPRPILLTGGRGVGKTVLLGEAAAIAAETRSWLTVPVEVRPNSRFTPQLVERLTAVRDLYQQTPRGQRVAVTGAKIRAAVLGFGAEVALTRRRADSTP